LPQDLARLRTRVIEFASLPDHSEPNEVNKSLRSVIIAPLTSQIKTHPTSVRTSMLGKDGYILLDQIRSVDKSRLKRKIRILDKASQILVLMKLQEMFEE
jgi:mRNA interferase MazF